MPRTKQSVAVRNSSLASCCDGEDSSTELVNYYKTSAACLESDRIVVVRKIHAEADKLIHKTREYFDELINSFPEVSPPPVLVKCHRLQFVASVLRSRCSGLCRLHSFSFVACPETVSPVYRVTTSVFDGCVTAPI